ncbi:MAG: RNA-binding S4 domain-containing protein [Synechococcaceae bacterium WBB_10_009]|nr:RNA-binding S4 domain-containing protein [Synechococcaceae bacterium WBB_10_009]
MRLDQFLKWQALVGTGGEAKMRIQGGAEGGNGGERRRQHHAAAGGQVGHQGLEGVGKGLRFGAGHVHLPVACDDGLAHCVQGLISP